MVNPFFWANANISFAGQFYIAVSIAFSGLTIDLISVFVFFKNNTTINPLRPEKASMLVIRGLYRISRNPMYLGMLLILTGFGIWLGNPINVLLITSFILIINALQIIPEEKALLKQFGEQYFDYTKRVRRWI